MCGRMLDAGTGGLVIIWREVRVGQGVGDEMRAGERKREGTCLVVSDNGLVRFGSQGLFCAGGKVLVVGRYLELD